MFAWHDIVVSLPVSTVLKDKKFRQVAVLKFLALMIFGKDRIAN
jgi:hypothetical protein